MCKFGVTVWLHYRDIQVTMQLDIAGRKTYSGEEDGKEEDKNGLLVIRMASRVKMFKTKG